MRALVNFEVLGPRKNLSTPSKGTSKWFFSSMNTNMIDKFVLGLERPAVPGAALPEARVRGAFGSTHVFYGQMRDYVLQSIERFPTKLPPGSRVVILVDPHAGHLLSLSHATTPGPAAPHVPQKSSMRMVARVAHRVLLVDRGREARMRRPEVLMVVMGQSRILTIVTRVVARRQGMVLPMMRELLHA